jgi:hypothetical protein
VRRSSKLDAFATPIQQLLARYPDITVTRVLEELRKEGYDGGYTILRQQVKTLRRQPKKPLVVRFETAPGLQAQMDWAVYHIDFTREGRSSFPFGRRDVSSQSCEKSCVLPRPLCGKGFSSAVEIPMSSCSPRRIA